ncbi:putative terpene synthase 12, partial [Turnera subulata]
MALKLFNLPYDRFSLSHSKASRFQYPRTDIYYITRSHYNQLITCSSARTQVPQAAADTEKRSATCSYQPTTWSFSFLQSLKYDNADEIYKVKAKKLEEEVRDALINGDADLLNMLEMIDDIQRLGLKHRFEEDIKRKLDKVFSSRACFFSSPKSLHATALCFRLLRQHGYDISQDIFSSFMDNEGDLLACVHEDAKGMRSLYEASFLCFEGEDLLEKAFMTSTKKNLVTNTNSNNMENLVSGHQALELPLHRKIHLLVARDHIEAYSRRDDANPLLLELAKLNFNMVQSVLKRDLKEMSSWWNDLGLPNKLSFARDRLMECFFWTVGLAFEPQFSSCRKGLTKVTSFITVIDDIYDVYGTLEELEMFTEAVERWDVNALKNLPGYMKICFLALYNTVNEMAYDNLKEHGANVIPVLTKA